MTNKEQQLELLDSYMGDLGFHRIGKWTGQRQNASTDYDAEADFQAEGCPAVVYTDYNRFSLWLTDPHGREEFIMNGYWDGTAWRIDDFLKR